jgi:hypothetical protein
MRTRNPKLSIVLNQHAPREDYSGHQEKTSDASTNKNIKNMHMVIKRIEA